MALSKAARSPYFSLKHRRAVNKPRKPRRNDRVNVVAASSTGAVSNSLPFYRVVQNHRLRDALFGATGAFASYSLLGMLDAQLSPFGLPVWIGAQGSFAIALWVTLSFETLVIRPWNIFAGTMGSYSWQEMARHIHLLYDLLQGIYLVPLD